MSAYSQLFPKLKPSEKKIFDYALLVVIHRIDYQFSKNWIQKLKGILNEDVKGGGP